MTLRQLSGILQRKKEEKKGQFRLGFTKGKMGSRLTGGGGGLCCELPAAVLLFSLPSALTEVIVNMVSEVGRETGGDGMKTGTGFRQPIPRELEGEIAVMRRSMILGRESKNER